MSNLQHQQTGALRVRDLEPLGKPRLFKYFPDLMNCIRVLHDVVADLLAMSRPGTVFRVHHTEA
jgi:hypothetical protein